VHVVRDPAAAGVELDPGDDAPFVVENAGEVRSNLIGVDQPDEKAPIGVVEHDGERLAVDREAARNGVLHAVEVEETVGVGTIGPAVPPSIKGGPDSLVRMRRLRLDAVAHEAGGPRRLARRGEAVVRDEAACDGSEPPPMCEDSRSERGHDRHARHTPPPPAPSKRRTACFTSIFRA
jgi:hypothetical protein